MSVGLCIDAEPDSVILRLQRLHEKKCDCSKDGT